MKVRACAVVLPCAAFVVSSAAAEMTVHFVDVGQGGGVFIQEGRQGISSTTGGDTFAATTMIDYLEAHDMTTIDVLIPSHAHKDQGPETPAHRRDVRSARPACARVAPSISGTARAPSWCAGGVMPSGMLRQPVWSPPGTVTRRFASTRQVFLESERRRGRTPLRAGGLLTHSSRIEYTSPGSSRQPQTTLAYAECPINTSRNDSRSTLLDLALSQGLSRSRSYKSRARLASQSILL